MDLQRMELTLDRFKDWPDDDPEKEKAYFQARWVVKHLTETFPALNESDHAAIAQFTAELMAGFADYPVRTISDSIIDNAVAYGLAAPILMGWLEG